MSSKLGTADEVAAVVAATRILARRLADPSAASAVDRRRLVRLSRALVGVAEHNDPAFLALLATAEAHRDPAGRAALAALLAIGVAREITTDRRALARLALTVLVADLGAVADPHGVPAATAAAVIEKLGADPAALIVAESTFEAAWIARERALGPLERSLAPRVGARILHAVRALLDRIAPPDSAKARPPLVALVEVGALLSVDPAVYRFMVRALGSTPAGMIVELLTGEWAVVLPPAGAEDPLDRPRLRLLTDTSGASRRPPVDIDLADAASQGVRIARMVDPTAASRVAAAALLRPD